MVLREATIGFYRIGDLPENPLDFFTWLSEEGLLNVRGPCIQIIVDLVEFTKDPLRCREDLFLNLPVQVAPE